MQEIIKLVTEKTGIPEAQAKMAVEAVAGYLKTKLPAPLATQVDAVLSGGKIPGLEAVTEGLGGLFGKK
jgi:hypothetical protein